METIGDQAGDVGKNIQFYSRNLEKILSTSQMCKSGHAKQGCQMIWVELIRLQHFYGQVASVLVASFVRERCLSKLGWPLNLPSTVELL